MGYWVCNKCGKKVADSIKECPTCRPVAAVDATRSLKKCPSCAMQIPDEAYKCPYCRKSVKTKPAAFVIASGVLLMMLVGMCSTQNTSKGPNKYDVQVNCESYVKGMLKAPDSAKFPGLSEWNIIEDEKEFTAYAFVDAQNSFGAMMRNSFKCTVSKPGLSTFCELY